VLHDRQTGLAQFMDHCVLMDTFQKPGSKRVQNLKRTPDDTLRKFVHLNYICVHLRQKFPALLRSYRTPPTEGH